MQRKLIFLDIDGTITMPGTLPTTETVNSIRSARKKGHLVFLCTGRGACFIDKAVAEIGFDGGIYHAGGRVLLQDKELVNQPLDTEKTETLIQLLSEMEVSITLEALDGTYTNKVKQNWREMDISKASSELLRQMEQMEKNTSKPLSEYDGQPIYKVSFRAFSQEQKEQVTSVTPDWAKLVWFDSFLPGIPMMAGEISDDKVTKATAMNVICDYLGASAEDCIAFGDSMNDAEILKAAGTGIAMGNASEEVKAIADLVCEGCTEDGIAKTLKRMNLI